MHEIRGRWFSFKFLFGITGHFFQLTAQGLDLCFSALTVISFCETGS